MANKKKTYLVFHDPVELYARDNLVRVFSDMWSGFEKGVDFKGFNDAAANFGSHIPKLVNPKATSAPVEYSPPHGRNQPYEPHASGNAANGKYAKAIMRPIAIEDGGEARSFVAHLQAPDELTEELKQAFVEVFGDEALAAVEAGLDERKSALARFRIHHSDYPVFFIPGTDSGDLQASPIAAGETYRNMQKLRAELFERQKRAKEENDEGRSPIIGDWIATEVSAKLQNAVTSLGGKRWRFLARFPAVSPTRQAYLWRFVSGGAFPSWRDAEAAKLVEQYVKIIDTGGYSNADIRRGLDHRANAIIARALRFIDEVLEDTVALHEDFDPQARRPEIWRVVASLPFDKGIERAVVSNVLQDRHFSERVTEAERKS